mgnify:CR=1 FL=1
MIVTERNLGSTMTASSVKTSMPVSALGSALSLHLLNDDIDGARICESRTSPLRVYAGPWQDLDALLRAGLPASPGFYLLTRSDGTRIAVRPGEAGDLRRRLLEHAADQTKAGYQEVFGVAGVDGRMSKSDVRFFEARCHEIVAAACHAALEVEKVPVVSSRPPQERAALETLLGQSRNLLYASGCRALDAPRMPVTPPVEDNDGGDVEIVDISGFGDDEHSLSYDGLWCWGHPTPAGGFVVRAGSDVRRRENGALLPGVAARRRRLAQLGVLGEMPGVNDRWRLLCNVRMPSQLMAAKVVTGAHVSNRGIWQRLSPASRIVAVDGV